LALKGNEIFYSIQGESSYTGRPCVFVRLTGCNLRCSYCDTQYAYTEGEELEIDEIVGRVTSYRCPLVEVTGGEPLIQKETPGLIHRLLTKGFETLMETNGSQDISQVDNRCVKIVDIKCPFSGQTSHNDLQNLNRLTDHDEVKFVIADREMRSNSSLQTGMTMSMPNRSSISRIPSFAESIRLTSHRPLAGWSPRGWQNGSWKIIWM